MTTKSREYPSRTEIQCNICYEYFFNSSSLRRHRRNLHGIVEPPKPQKLREYPKNKNKTRIIPAVPGNWRCSYKLCFVCPKIKEGGSFRSKVTGREYSILSPPEVTKQWRMIVERESSSQKAAGRRWDTWDVVEVYSFNSCKTQILDHWFHQVLPHWNHQKNWAQ